MKIAVIAVEESGAIIYNVGFYVRENQKELFLATEYDAVTDKYTDTFGIPTRFIRRRQMLKARRQPRNPLKSGVK